MTVAELIEALSLLNPEAIVVTHDDSYNPTMKVIVEAAADASAWDSEGRWISGIDAVSITSY